MHVPLIEIAEPLDGGAELQAVLHMLDNVDWVVVTSHHGAARVGEALARHPNVRTAAVGTRTAAELERLAGRPVDVVPARQTAADLLEAMPPNGHGQIVVVAHADRADPALAVGLSGLGYRVRPVVAYRTLARTPSAEERAAALAPTPSPSPADRRPRRGTTRSARRRRQWWSRSARRPKAQHAHAGSTSPTWRENTASKAWCKQ